jgi:hypothetical protein
MIRAVLRFWRDFVVGDDWRIAAGVVAALTLGAVLVASEAVSDDVLAPVIGLGIVVVAGLSIASTHE